MSLRGRVVLAVTAAVTVAIALAAVASFLIVRAELVGQVDASLKDRLAGRHFTIVQISPTQVAPFPDLPPAALGGAEGYVQVVSAQGRVFRPEGERIALPVSASTRAVAAGAAPFFASERVAGVHVRIYTASTGNGFAIQIARPLSEVDGALSRLGGILLIVTLAGAALAAGAGLLIARAGLRPVRRLTDAVERVGATRDLTQRIEETGTDEVGRLAARFNAMLDALQAAEAAQRQLVADASHELRTPLTSVRTNIEVLARGDQLSREERERILRDVVAELEEFSVLVGDLVDLAREGAGATDRTADEAMEDVRLDELVAAAVERARRHAPGAVFRTELEPCVVRGLPGRIDRAVANLLDNAVKWSPQGGEIDVAVRDGRVTVRDHGPGIPEEDLPFVFDRFYRAAASRGLPGSGLGLAIVRQVAESHGGAAEAAPAEGGGARLSLRLPVAAGALVIPPRP